MQINYHSVSIGFIVGDKLYYGCIFFIRLVGQVLSDIVLHLDAAHVKVDTEG